MGIIYPFKSINDQTNLIENMRIVLVSIFILSFSLTNAQIIEDDNTPAMESPAPIANKENPYKHLDSLHYSRKAIYNIAFILPIKKNSISKGSGKERAAAMSSESREALGFWEGVNVAFPTIAKMNAKFKIHVWDNERNDSVTKEIIKEISSKKIDAVVAPFHSSQALLISRYCREKKIPMFLAQNSSDMIAKDNPYVFKFHMPKNRTYYDYYVKIILDNAKKNTDIFYVYDGINKAERKVANYLKFMAEKDGSKRLKLLEYNSDLNFKPYLDTTRDAVYMIGYSETATVNEILGKLAQLKPHNVTVFGHNYWASNTKINKSLLDTLDAKVFTDSYLENNPTLLSKVKSDYAALTKDRAVTDVFLGYDVAMYITTVLNNYGVKFPLSIKDFSYRGAYINVKMRPIYDSNSGLLFFENDLKNLLRATNNGWVKEFVPSE
jgi:hypothetical protein